MRLKEPKPAETPVLTHNKGNSREASDIPAQRIQMFIHEHTQRRIHATPGETVSRATLRPQDLLPAFLSVLRETPEYVQITQALPAHIWEDEEAEYWSSEECSYLLNEEIFNLLQHYAPEGYYFGSHPGDGSDFAYWKIEEEAAQ